jgi:hypothetical protein
MALSFVLGFAAAAVMLQVIRMIFNSWQHSRNAKKLGCGSVPMYPCKDPFGIDNLKQSLAADKAKLVPELAEERVKVISNQENRYVTTFSIRNLGRTHIFTIDPKNIQAVLATQFKDFELGSVRQISLHPLLGTGIVSHILTNTLLILSPKLVLTVHSSPPMERNGADPVAYFGLSSPASKSVNWTWKRSTCKRPCKLCPSQPTDGPPQPTFNPSSSV